VNEWLEQFYTDPEFRAALLAAYGPIFSQFAADIAAADGGAVNPAFVQALTDTYVDGHLDSSRAQLQTLLDEPDPAIALEQRLDEWVEKRPAKVAAEQTVRGANAMAMDEMRLAGVQQKVWRTTGAEDCPYCSSLEGKTIGVEDKFFEHSDTFLPDGATRPLRFNNDHRHPPIHQGCDCYIEAAG
jgi:hypothetical protein